MAGRIRATTGCDCHRRRRRRARAALTASAFAAASLLSHRALADISGFDPASWTTNGGATITNNSLQLTDTTTGFQARSAFFNTAQDIASGFTAQFTYNLSGTAGLGPADGITFLLSSPTNGR
jgi:hypothetical protein